MSRFAAGRASYGVRRPKKCLVRAVPASSAEAREVERDYDIPTKGFCHECEAYVDEESGKLHRASCKTTAERRAHRHDFADGDVCSICDAARSAS